MSGKSYVGSAIDLSQRLKNYYNISCPPLSPPLILRGEEKGGGKRNQEK
jgi:hypothetical protein